MVHPKSSDPRPMNVFVRPGSKAELACRRYAAGSKVQPKEPQVEAIAGGFATRKDLNLVDHYGKIIPDLVYTNFFVGAAAWDPRDMQRIDRNLSKAMADPQLNSVLLQYFRGAAKITSTFRPSSTLAVKPDSISQPEVEDLLTQLHGQGKLARFDFANTLFNFMLPPETVLTIGDGSGDKGPADGSVEEKASSLEGLGGFHGSVQAGATKIYYAVGVFSDGDNGIVAFDQPWKNVVATFYHELVEARTDADVEDNRVAWVNNERPSEEIGDIPMTLAGADLSKVIKEVPLADGSGTMWSNAVGGPEGPIAAPRAL